MTFQKLEEASIQMDTTLGNLKKELDHYSQYAILL